ncbi:hypothetical protein [Bacillus thuringiensis]|nr:hypothetical protein [Bacillus thuringiensis]
MLIIFFIAFMKLLQTVLVVVLLAFIIGAISDINKLLKGRR